MIWSGVWVSHWRHDAFCPLSSSAGSYIQTHDENRLRHETCENYVDARARQIHNLNRFFGNPGLRGICRIARQGIGGIRIEGTGRRQRSQPRWRASNHVVSHSGQSINQASQKASRTAGKRPGAGCQRVQKQFEAKQAGMRPGNSLPALDSLGYVNPVTRSFEPPEGNSGVHRIKRACVPEARPVFFAGLDAKFRKVFSQGQHSRLNRAALDFGKPKLRR